MSNFKEYFEGKKLYGDDFSIEQITEWYEDEKDAYLNLWENDGCNYKYGYHYLNYKYAFSFLPSYHFDNVLCLGGAYGDELLPIRDRIGQITIVESTDKFSKNNKDLSITYVKSQPSGELLFPNDYFDLITCFGTLHHIPNVSKVVKEIYRCAMRGGYVLIREPIVSMGDWREERRGLTKRERGIPLHIFRRIIADTGFNIINDRKCMFSLTSRLRYFVKDSVYNFRSALLLDRWFCMLFGWNNTYHATNLFLKLRPTSIFYALYKQ